MRSLLALTCLVGSVLAAPQSSGRPYPPPLDPSYSNPSAASASNRDIHHSILGSKTSIRRQTRAQTDRSTKQVAEPIVTRTVTAPERAPIVTRMQPIAEQAFTGAQQVTEQSKAVTRTKVVPHDVAEPIVTRTDAIVTNVNLFVTRVDAIVTRADPIVTRVDPIVTRVDAIVTRVDPIVTRADAIVTKVDPIVTTVDPIVTRADPIVTRADPIVTRTQQIPGRTVIETELIAEPIVTRVQPIAGYSSAIIQQ
ncbi:uncharacterized protein LOC122385572 [Amphibalanus amphitrite]|uniref:uncharacterized protein LOC122385572 n=1 Tax=Amphibalanus amphitrite TaxID=1232801 RepID=UPI001C9266B0|nr:uncharacterized protein LOC122385572 [Amphibalanus amphitrite]